MGLTILKRLCRRFGLARWPYKRPRKSDKKKSASADRDGELSKEYSQADTVSEEKEKEQVNNTESDGHRDADEVCKVVQNTNISTHQDTNIQSKDHGMCRFLFPMPRFDVCMRQSPAPELQHRRNTHLTIFHCRSSQHAF